MVAMLLLPVIFTIAAEDRKVGADLGRLGAGPGPDLRATCFNWTSGQDPCFRIVIRLNLWLGHSNIIPVNDFDHMLKCQHETNQKTINTGGFHRMVNPEISPFNH